MTTYSAKEFIDYTKEHPEEWINYCEIVILQNGRILLARPSHQECILDYVSNLEGKTRDQIWEELKEDLLDPLHFYVDRYVMVSVWYEYIIKSSFGMNKYQKKTLDDLIKVGLVSQNPKIIETDEYQKLILRKELEKGF